MGDYPQAIARSILPVAQVVLKAAERTVVLGAVPFTVRPQGDTLGYERAGFHAWGRAENRS
jgi:hypothetical protein